MKEIRIFIAENQEEAEVAFDGDEQLRWMCFCRVKHGLVPVSDGRSNVTYTIELSALPFDSDEEPCQS